VTTGERPGELKRSCLGNGEGHRGLGEGLRSLPARRREGGEGLLRRGGSFGLGLPSRVHSEFSGWMKLHVEAENGQRSTRGIPL
jgi:hypothetical protein